MRTLTACILFLIARAGVAAPPTEAIGAPAVDSATPVDTRADAGEPRATSDSGEGEGQDAPEDEGIEEAPDEGPAEEPEQNADDSAHVTEGSASDAFAVGHYAEASRLWQALVEARPDAPTLRYREAVSAALAGDLSAGRDAAAHVERLDPGNPAAMELAFALHKMLIPIANSRQDAPEDVAAARQALADGRLRTAERLAARGLAKGGSNQTKTAPLHRTRGQALLALGRPAGAIEALKAAAGAGHSDPDVWLTLTEAARRLGHSEVAEALQVLAAFAPPPLDASAPKENP